MGGTRYLRKLLDRYQGDRKLALAAYNWGPRNVERQLITMPKETKRYINKVENKYQTFLMTPGFV
jgi:soluble lytic murein transglycosylase-like protein